MVTRQINLSWTAPSDDGGADITGYRIEVSEDGAAWSDLTADTGDYRYHSLPHRIECGNHASLPSLDHKLRRHWSGVEHCHRNYGSGSGAGTRQVG